MAESRWLYSSYMDLETLLWRKFQLDHGGTDFQQRGEVLKLCLAGRMVLVLASEVKFSTSLIRYTITQLL